MRALFLNSLLLLLTLPACQSFATYTNVLVLTGVSVPSISASSGGGGNTNLTSQGYYVAYGLGSDTAAGTSTATAWYHAPGDPQAASVPNSVVLSNSGTIFFEQGVTYQLLGATGIMCSNNWTYTSTNAWGASTNRAIVTDNHSGNLIVAFNWNRPSTNIAINNLEIGPIGGASNTNDSGNFGHNGWGVGIESSPPSHNLQVVSCYIHDIGFDGCCNIVGGNTNKPIGAGVTLTDSDNGIVSNNNFYAAVGPIEIYTTVGSSNIFICNNTFGPDELWTIDFNIIGGSRSNIYFYDNVWTNSDVMDAKWAGTNNGGGCGIACFHADAIYDEAEQQSEFFTEAGIYIWNNRFVDTTTTNAGGSAVLFMTGTTGNKTYFYNNEVQNYNGSPADIYYNPGSTNIINMQVGVYNNTIIHTVSSPDWIFVDTDNNQPSPSGGTNVYNNLLPTETLQEYNNIVWQTGGQIYNIAAGNILTVQTNLVFDYDDLYYPGAPGPGMHVMYWDASADGYTDWGSSAGSLSYYGIPTAWETRGSNTSPSFASTVTWAVSSGSPAYLTGTNLTALFLTLGLPGGTTNAFGVARPATGNWNMGWN